MRESLNYRCVDNGRIPVIAEGVALMDSFVRFLCTRTPANIVKKNRKDIKGIHDTHRRIGEF